MNVCLNCGNNKLEYFGLNKNKQLYCRLCLPFNGESAKKNDNLSKEKVSINLSYQLSKEQEEISNKVKETFINKKNSLIYAVCGAGKTELVYQTMAYALEQGLQVGFTIPRRDVVIELEKRIKEVFPTKKVVSIYQDHSQELIGDIIILTTHQLYRYKSYFDLLIIDEVDAFPFKDNYILNHFFNRSLKGNYIILSATPSNQLIEEIKNKKGKLFSLTKRYHNHPLIVPNIQIKIFFKKLFLIGKINKYKKERKKLLIFVPTKDQCECLFNQINIFCPNGNYVHSERKNRNKIIEEFKNNKYDYLVTTSVLERGITIPFLQVIVYDADHLIFDADTLIQISGRVGRKKESWDGEVTFLANKKTKHMEEAINRIKEANNENFL